MRRAVSVGPAPLTSLKPGSEPIQMIGGGAHHRIRTKTGGDHRCFRYWNTKLFRQQSRIVLQSFLNGLFDRNSPVAAPAVSATTKSPITSRE